jgi:predicted flap endonuclease-1-like 5' DNA nuclease
LEHWDKFCCRFFDFKSYGIQLPVVFYSFFSLRKQFSKVHNYCLRRSAETKNIVRFGYNPNFMAYNIDEIEGIGPAYGQKLQASKIGTTVDLLERAATKKGRQQLAEDTGIPESQILKWVNHADLFRINGVAGQFSELLEAAGVDTVKEFATRNAENLHIKLVETNQKKKLTGRVPSLESLKEMIAHAKTLEPKISY